MKTTQEILQQLERLESHLRFTIEQVKSNGHDPFHTTTNNTFRVGDFVVTDMCWTTNQQSCYEAGWKKGMEDSQDMRSKGLDPQIAIDAWTKNTCGPKGCDCEKE